MASENRVRHGYTLATLDDLTRVALSQTIDGRGLMSAADRYHVVWSGIAVALYEADQRPTREDLVRAGWRALAEARDQEMQAHGYRLDHGEVHIRHAFGAYWRTPGEPAEERLIEHLAVQQTLSVLSPRQRAAVTAVAALGGYAAAQTALGITRSTLTDHLMNARLRVLEAWMPGETPIPPRYVHDRKPIKHGTPHGARAHRKRRERPCEECRAAVPPDSRTERSAA